MTAQAQAPTNRKPPMTLKKRLLNLLFPRPRRPRPFWRVRFDDEFEPLSAKSAFDIGAQFLQQMWLIVISAFVILGALAVAAPIAFSPDFWTLGLADPIGRGLAAVCIHTGQCELPYLMLGSVFAAMFYAVAACSVSMAIRFWLSDSFWGNEDDGLFDVAKFLDERITRLRDDFIAAGVLPKAPDEIEADDADR